MKSLLSTNKSIEDINPTDDGKLNLFAIGRIVGCFGVKGYLKIKPETSSIERYNKLHHVFIGVSPNMVISEIVDKVNINLEPILLKLRSVNDKTSADKIIGRFIFIEEKEVIQLKKDTYFVHDIIGCEVWSCEGILIGKIVDVYKLPAQNVWMITKAGKKYFIPAVKEFIKEVNVKARKIVIRTIEGLIEE